MPSYVALATAPFTYQSNCVRLELLRIFPPRLARHGDILLRLGGVHKFGASPQVDKPVTASSSITIGAGSPAKKEDWGGKVIELIKSGALKEARELWFKHRKRDSDTNDEDLQNVSFFELAHDISPNVETLESLRSLTTSTAAGAAYRAVGRVEKAASN